MTFTTPDDIIPVKSPLALTGVFLEILRARFSVSQGLDWEYIPGDIGRTTSTIHIEAAKNPETEEYGRRPAIYIDRGPIQISQPVIGDVATFSANPSSKVYYAIAQTNFVFAIEAELPAEAELISDIVLSTLLMGSDVIEKTFSFRKLGPFALGSRGKARQDTEITQISVNMGLSYDVRWRSQQIAPLLKEVIVKARESTYTNSDDYFIEIFQHSLLDSPNSTS